MFKTPKLPFTRPDYKDFYEPAEDSFVVLDGIEKDFEFLKTKAPSIALEIGPGSGINLAFLARIFKNCFCMGLDINQKACAATLKTADANKVIVEVIEGDLLYGLRKNICDIILFNPPYVPTPQDEVGKSNIEAAWSGGDGGRVVIDKVLEIVQDYLAPRGILSLWTRKDQICTLSFTFN